ncbi:MAG TPA: immunoglobulin domain-containing protein [Phycisphaerales bacterium]|nr:immunoglobulin domain-containing protein [Phycisphaerales bacterium]
MRMLSWCVACVLFVVANAAVAQQDATTRLWTLLEGVTEADRAEEAWIRPEVFQAARLDMAGMVAVLRTAPREFTREAEANPLTITLPMPDGSTQQFAVVESPVMEEGLAAQFPEIRTFSGKGLHDTYATVRLDCTPQGFHAMVRSPFGDVFIDPFSKGNTGLYAVYYKRDYTKQHEWTCGTPSSETPTVLEEAVFNPYAARNANPLRTYRLACAATGEYTAFHGGTVALGQAAVVTAINRVTGVYETELGIRLTLVANNSSIIYTNANSDPYTNNNGSTMLGQNQTTCTNVIGNANYDIGHVFSTAGGGIAGLGVVCSSTNKARGVTGQPSPNGDPFWIDYVAHEMGHQFGGNHTFNGSGGSCSGNRSASTAYEPGSGSTIMAYAGICGSDNLQANSNAYFSFISMQEITTFTTSGGGSSCDATTSTGNTAPTANAGADFTIPFGTPFTLTGTGADANNDAITYCWEQRDTRSTGFTLASGDPGAGAIMRSWSPVVVPSRTIPRVSNLIANTFAPGEILPDAARTLNFRLTTRDNRAGAGGFGSDDMVVTVASAGPFQVTSPNTNVSWTGGSQQTVTWAVNGTNAAPVSTASVRILLSTDGGNTFPTVVLASTPNDGSEVVTVPGVSTTQARIKVEAVNNIYFDISNANFSITGCSGPVIVGQPGNTSACPGAPASFSVGAAGTGLTYQWRKNGGNIGGATGSVYTIPAVSGNDAGAYDCVVSGACGSPATSQAATLSISTPVAITSQPASQTACFGGSVTFTVVAGGSPSPSYQWRKGQGNIAGATGPSLTIDPVQQSSAATYSCIVSNSCGSVTSDGATLTVQLPPSVVNQPSPQTVCVGQPLTVSVLGAGSPSPTYQWRKGGNNLSGQTSATLSIPSVSAGDQGSYDCVLTNACDSTTSQSVFVTVNSAPQFISGPVSQEGCVGASAVFSVSVSGSPVPTLQWRFNGSELTGETGTTLTVSPITPGSQGSYDCVATNGCTSVPSAAATLAVNTAPVVTGHPSDVTVDEGSQASFTVAASGSGVLSYQWRYNGGAISNTPPYSGVDTATLTIDPAAAGVAGSYDCIVSNGCGSAPSNAATLAVDENGCGTADFNGDGDIGTDADIEAFFSCLGGSCCAECFEGGADFNADGDTGTDADIESFFRVLGGGAC